MIRLGPLPHLATLVMAVALGLALSAPVIGQTPAAAGAVVLPAPTGPVLLTVVPTPDPATPAAPPIRFDQAMLAALPQVTITTTTIWTDGPQEFTGVPVSALLAATGLQGGTLVAMAANDYLIGLPVAELTDQAPIIAYLRNGKPMTTRDKGPLWIVYPYDSDPAYRTEVVYARSIWQLDRIEVQP